MTEFCSRCQTEYRSPEEKFCGNCGAPRPVEADSSSLVTLQNNHTVMLKLGSSDKGSPKEEASRGVGTLAEPFVASLTYGSIAPATAVLADAETAKLEVQSPTIETAKLEVPAADNATIEGTGLAEQANPLAEVAEAEQGTPDTTVEAAGWQCPQCQHENAVDAEYCDECGAMYVSPAELAAKIAANIPSTITLEDEITPYRAFNIQDGQKAGWRLHSGSNTNEGVVRQGHADEDSVFVLELQRFLEARPESFGLYIVADGMGGQAAGEEASRNAIEKIAQVIMQELALPWLTNRTLEQPQIEEILEQAVQAGHNQVHSWNSEHEKDSGSTLTLACLINGKATFANVGDSRTYLFRRGGEEILPELETLKFDPSDNVPPPTINNGRRSTDKLKYNGEVRNPELTRPAEEIEEHLLLANAKAAKPYEAIRVTRDQSLVQQLVDAGIISADDVYTDPRRNMVLNGLGANEGAIPVDIYHRELEAGDRILLCSDGLWEMVRDPQMAQVLTNNLEPQVAVDELVKLACQNGGEDNVSVIVVAVSN